MAGDIPAVATCSVALITADIIDIPALPATSAAAIAGAATEPPANDGNAESPDNAAAKASNPAPYRNPAEALLGHINPKYSPSNSINRPVNIPNTHGLIALSMPHSPRLALACTWVTICGTVVVCNSPAALSNCPLSIEINEYDDSSTPNCAPAATDASDPRPAQLAVVAAAFTAELATVPST